MDPDKARLLRMRVHPRFRAMDYIFSAALHDSPMLSVRRAWRKVIVIIEPSIEPGSKGARIKHHRTDERRCLIPILLKQLGPGGISLLERHGEVGDPMYAGQQAGQNAGV